MRPGARGTGASVQSQFNRKAFSWGNPAQKKEEKEQPKEDEECSDRTYEVLAISGTVRAEPHIGAKLKTKKSRGSRFLCSEMTMNGWLKLVGETGWMAAHMRGIDNVMEVALPLENEKLIDLAVPVYQPQGMCCLEVVFKTGVPVRESPSRKSKTLTTRKCGEYVFAHLQNFDGWIKLAGEDGWMLAFDQEWGELLRVRRGLQDTDLWALSDAWSSARVRPGPSRTSGLTSKEIEALKELEERVLIEARSTFTDSVRMGNKQKLLETGLLTPEDLPKSESWIRQRLFANILVLNTKNGEGWVRELIPNLQLTARVPPLPGPHGEKEDLDDCFSSASGSRFGTGLRKGFFNPGSSGGASASRGGRPSFDPAFEGTRPFEYKGKVYTMAPNGVVFDPPNQVPMGIWNPECQRLDPAAGMMPGCPYPAISYLGRTYILLPDERLLDPETEQIVGSFNKNTNEMELNDPALFREMAGAASSHDTYDPVFNDGEPVDPYEYLQRGHQMVKAGRFKAASSLYSEALKSCSQQRAVDLDLEVEILRARANCWRQLGCYQDLQEDAERIISATGGDNEAEDWRRMAAEGLQRKARSGPSRFTGRPQPQEPPLDPDMPRSSVKCAQCNGMASRCAQCGAGMERCGYCSQPVSRANCCSRCHCTYYCGRECQRSHWKVHKLVCKSALE